jgi:large subunit ribosomal protein L24
MKVHKGDTVLVISGKDKGAKGKAAGLPDAEPGARRGRQPDQEAHRAVDQRAGRVLGRHRHPGGAIHVSNVMVVDSDGKPARVGYRVDEETGKRVRISKRNGKDI